MKRKTAETRLLKYHSLSEESDIEEDEKSYKISVKEDVEKGSRYYEIEDKIETFEHTNVNEREGGDVSSTFRYVVTSRGGDGSASSYRDVVEKQMFRLRRICATDQDFVWTVNKLRERYVLIYLVIY